MLDLTQSLLPLASLKKEHALDAVTARILDFDLSNIDIKPLTCDVVLLPWLAYQWRVEIKGLTDSEKRKLIHNAKEIHKYRGTVYAVKLALYSVFQNAVITEYRDERVFEFDAHITLTTDINTTYDASKFNTARKLIKDAKNGRSRFGRFTIELPNMETSVIHASGASLSPTFENQLELEAETNTSLHAQRIFNVRLIGEIELMTNLENIICSAISWDIDMGVSL